MLRRLVLIGTVTLLFAACTGSPDVSVSSTGATSVGPPSGGTLRLGQLYWQYPDDVKILDPQEPYGIFAETEMLRCCLLRTLFSYNGSPTEQGGAQPQPDLASEQPTVSPDGLTWTFHIQSGLHYGPPLQDTEITTPDIVRALERAADPKVAAAFPPAYGGVVRSAHPFDFDLGMIHGFSDVEHGDATQISGLEAPDPHTLIVHLDRATNDLLYRFALTVTAPLPPNPADPLARYGVAQGHDGDYGWFLVSSGPYMIEGAPGLDLSKPPSQQERLPGLRPEGITLVRNPAWNAATDSLHGDSVDSIHFVPVSGVNDADEKIRSGAMDALFDSTNAPAFLKRFERDPARTDRVFQASSPPQYFLAMNLAMAPFDDVNVRKAMNHAVDRADVADTASTGTDAFGYPRYLPLTHIAPDSATDGLNRDYVPYPYDVNKARALMRMAPRYDTDGNGRCDVPACRNVTAIDADIPSARLADSVLARDFRAIGIDLRIRFLPLDEWYATALDPTAHVALDLLSFSYQSFPNATPLFTSQFTGAGIGTTLSPDASSNQTLMGASPTELRRWGYDITQVPNVDANVAACASQIGFAQIRCWSSLDRLLMEQTVPVIPITSSSVTGVLSDRVARYGVDASSFFLSPDRFVLAPGSD